MTDQSVPDDFLWYLASPYANADNPGDYQLPFARYQQVCIAAAKLTVSGIHVYSPILISETMRRFYPTLQVDQQFDSAFWLNGIDSTMMKRCDGIIILALDGWDKSKGIEFERNYFVEQRKPEVFLSNDFSTQQQPVEKIKRMLDFAKGYKDNNL